jgi:preprotein translocase subunit SecE
VRDPISATEGEVAENKRRSEDAGDDRLADETADEVNADNATDADEPVSRGGTATRARAKAESAGDKKTRKDTERVGIFARIGRFFREVVAELRKVIWPTRKELLTYTAVVVTFVTVVLTIVAGLDFAFAKGVLFVFGNGS